MNTFRPARDVTKARLLKEPPSFVREYARRKGRRYAGIRYQRAVDALLAQRFGGAYLVGPWIEFFTGEDNERRYCQPDGVLIELERGRITIVEVKYSHTELAYFQLFDLYLPVLQQLFPPNLWTFATIEVCSRFDVAVVCPRKPVMRKEILDALPREFNVHIWRPHTEG